jgi:hypothetical protein
MAQAPESDFGLSKSQQARARVIPTVRQPKKSERSRVQSIQHAGKNYGSENNGNNDWGNEPAGNGTCPAEFTHGFLLKHFGVFLVAVVREGSSEGLLLL